MANPRKIAQNPPSVSAPLKGYYSNAVKAQAGPLLFIAGQVAIDKQVKIVGKGDLKAQAVQVLENIKAILEANNATMDDIVKVTLYVTDMRAYHELTDIRRKYFPKDGPASVIVEVSKLALPELMVEIEAVAVVN